MIKPPRYVSTIKPYVPGKPVEELERELGITDSVKLASNENPLGPSPVALEKCRDSLRDLQRNRQLVTGLEPGVTEDEFE